MSSETTHLQIDDAVLHDLTHLVHPMTEHSTLNQDTSVVFREAHGIRLTDTAGLEYLDAMAGLMNVHIGYGRTEMAETARKAMETLSYAPLFFGYSNVPATQLAAKLASITPSAIERFLFTLTGSDAIDTAIKLARLRNGLRGHSNKNLVISRRGGYHGLTLAAMTATGQPNVRENFGPLPPGFAYVDQPIGEGADVTALEDAIEVAGGSEAVAAFIAEPISVPAGVHLPPDGYWNDVRRICDKYDVLLIVDEVITGFGRTGDMFGCQTFDIQPDLLVLSKGLTSGYQPVAAVGMTDGVYADITPPGKTLMHGFTSSGHPVACAVALCNISIIEDEALADNASKMGAYLRARLQEASEAANNAGEVRGVGLLAAFDINFAGRNINDHTLDAERVAIDLRRRRVLLRRYGETLALAPALSVTEEDIDAIVGEISLSMRSVSPPN